jgi:hypothetical protein
MKGLEVTQSPVTQKIKGPGQHYASPLDAVQATSEKSMAPVHYYECADCQDLYERLRNVFREMGHEF